MNKNLENKIPNIGWPEEFGFYKVIQLMKGDQPYLRYLFDNNSEKRSFHRDIVLNFAKEINVECEKRKSCLGGKKEIPWIPESSGYKIVGMGEFLFNHKQKQVMIDKRLKSQDYGLGINKEHLELIKALSPDIKISLEDD